MEKESYKIIKPFIEGTSPTTIKRLSDSAFIPMDPGNNDYKNYLKWLAEGNTPEPADE